MKKVLILLSILLVSCSQNIKEKEIKKEELLNTVKILSSPEFDGRLAGSEGYFKAAHYAAERFKNNGLKSFYGDNYFQEFNIEFNQIENGSEAAIITKSGQHKLKLGKDYIFRGFTGSGNFTADVVYCGYGISRPDLGYDDYKNIDVKGKVVAVFKYNPKWKFDKGNWKNNYPREKSLVAKAHGARGIIFLSLPNDKTPQVPIGSVLSGKGPQPIDFPQVHISLEKAKLLFENSKISLKDLQTEIDSKKKPHSLKLKSKFYVNVKAEYEKERKTVNVIGLLEGKEMKEEYIVLGAHLDHVGRQSDSVYFPGANDNASGSAAVLEIARAMHENNFQPKRSIIFVLFSSEEAGLFGAKHFVENSPVPLENIVAMLNMDCIAFGDSIRVGGGKSSSNLWNLIKELDSNGDKMMVKSTWKGGGADATPFFEKKIPTAYFVTTNSYKHLHMTTDKVETLNGQLYEKLVRLVYRTLENISSGNYQREKI